MCAFEYVDGKFSEDDALLNGKKDLKDIKYDLILISYIDSIQCWAAY